ARGDVSHPYRMRRRFPRLLPRRRLRRRARHRLSARERRQPVAGLPGRSRVAPPPLNKQSASVPALSRQSPVAVLGVGHTRYGKLPEYDAYALGLWALTEALADAGLTFADVDGLIVNRIPDYQRFCEIAGLNPSYVNITPGQGRFSGICIETAAALIRDGLASTVALVYGNNGRSGGDRYGRAGDTYGSGGGRT